MNSLSTFGALLAADINNKTFKSVKFSDASSLNNSIENLSVITAGDENIDAQPDVIRSTVEAYGELHEDRLHNGVYLDVYDEISNTFASILSKGINNLKTLKAEVETIETKINANIRKFISEDPVLAEYDKRNADPDQLGMEGVDWSILDQVSERATIEKLHDSINQPIDAQLSPVLMGMILNKLPNANQFNTKEYKSIPLTQENRKRIVASIYAEVKDKFKESDVASLVDFVFDFNTSYCLSAIRSLEALKDGENVESINQVLTIVDKYANILNYFTKENVDLSNSTQVEVDDHVDAMRQILDASVYVCSYYRHNVWNESILVPGPRINPDKFDEYKANGGKISDVVQYNTRYFSDSVMPKTGVKGTDIITTMNNVRSIIQSEVAEHSRQCEAKKKQIHRDVFMATVYDWLNSKRDKFSREFAHTSTLDKFIISVYDGAAPNSSLESLLYTAMLNSCYVNSIEKNIYNRISNAYAKHVAVSNKLTKEDCELIDIAVYSDMICEYLVNKGIIEA